MNVSTMKVRVGIIGAGFVSNIHAEALAGIHDVDLEIVAVAATSLTSAQAFADKHGIPHAYDDYRRVLDHSDINLVDVCVPNILHDPVAVAAAEAGKHVICEKPLTGYFGGEGAADPVGATQKSMMLVEALRSADRMIKAAEAASVKLMYAENWVYCPVVQKTLELIEVAGGTIFQIRAEESHSGSHAPYSRAWAKAGGGALVRLASHPIGAALYLKQREGICRDGRPIHAASVSAEVGDLSKMASFQAESKHWVVDDWSDVENWCALIITFEDESRALISASDVVLGGMEDRLEVVMSNGRIACDMTHSGLMKAFAPNATIWGDAYIMEKVDHKGGWTFPSVNEHWMLGYPQEMRDFVEAVAYDRQPLSTGELGREVVQVIYAAYRSAEEGRRVDLERWG
jgi:predicted dehydrogenase